jgi:predicted CXXCH cytochrome family protein
MQPSYPGYQVVEAAFNDVSTGCLVCHGPTYEDLRAKTANYTTEDYVYDGEYIQPHVYINFSQGNHISTDGPNCLECHTAHELPLPASPIKKANLNYCIGCHHAGELISCSECH